MVADLIPTADDKGDLTPSFVRTLVPILVGIIISWALRHGFNLDQAEVGSWLTPAVTAAYYVIVRTLEKQVPAVGWLLGLAKQPGYSDQPPPAPAPTAEPLVVAGASVDEVQEIVNNALDAAVAKLRRVVREKR